MKRLASAMLLVAALPAPALAAGSTFGLLVGMVKLGAILAVCVGGILVLAGLVRRLTRERERLSGRQRLIRVVETKPLPNRKALILIEVGGEYLLLANTPDSIRLLKDVSVEEVGAADSPAIELAGVDLSLVRANALELFGPYAARLAARLRQRDGKLARLAAKVERVLGRHGLSAGLECPNCGVMAMELGAAGVAHCSACKESFRQVG